jgi:hypothetical protein
MVTRLRTVSIAGRYSRGAAALLALVTGGLLLLGPVYALADDSDDQHTELGPLMMMDGADKDGDSRMSFEEYKQAVRSRYASFDADGDGKVTKDEVISRLMPWVEMRAERAVSRLDQNDDGQISADEDFEHALIAFGQLDLNGDGFLDGVDDRRGGFGGGMQNGRNWQGGRCGGSGGPPPQ